ncbi:MAG: hypothetical protein HYY44_00280 [Deltaproteobacteria bacterium]|nr:hypothetical protein [Deltaproteobacteria bacterium]
MFLPRSFAFSFLAVLLLPALLFSQDGAVIEDAPSAITEFNRLIRPQFKTIPLGSPNEPALNGGVGNGVARPDGTGSFFCGGLDEANQYRLLHDLPSTGAVNAGTPDNMGTYRFVGVIDRCRDPQEVAENFRCGDIEPDDRQTVIGFPTHATNCHPWGRDDNYWSGGSAGERLYEDNPDGAGAPRDPGHSGYRGRNFFGARADEESDFLYSRFLVGQLENFSRGDAGSVADRLGARINTGRANHYRFDQVTGHALDIPWTLEHLRWGFTCAAAARTGGYRRINRQFRNLPTDPPFRADGEPLEQQRFFHYYRLLDLARQRLASEIAAGTYGDFYSEEALANPDVRASREIAVSVENILEWCQDKLVWIRPCPEGGIACGVSQAFVRMYNRFIRGQDLRLMSCPVPEGTILECRPGGRQCCVDPQIAADCLSKRGMGASSSYNDGPTGEGTACVPSYGARESGGLYEPVDGDDYELYDAGDHVGGRVRHGDSAVGYSPMIVAELAHGCVHAYYDREEGRHIMTDYPSTQESLYQETLATLARSLTYYHLCQLGYCPTDFRMEAEPFVRSYVIGSGGRVTSATTGTRYRYRNICRGYGGLFLGPYCWNMLSIGRCLEEGNPELCRMMALLHSQSPFLDPPATATINGAEGPIQGVLEGVFGER